MSPLLNWFGSNSGFLAMKYWVEPVHIPNILGGNPNPNSSTLTLLSFAAKKCPNSCNMMSGPSMSKATSMPKMNVSNITVHL